MIKRKELIDEVISILGNKKADNIRLIDVNKFDYLVDFIIIANGEAKNHRDVLEYEVRYKLKKEYDLNPNSVEKDRYSEWIVMDYGWFVVHIMSEYARVFYDIEGLWQR